jgi:predicted outer membrane repeat protein
VLWMALAGLAALAPASARAATWSVNDTTDTPIGQACPGFSNCSLREAVTSTEANPGADAILISAGTYPLTNGQLTVTQDLTVSKVGAGVATIDGNDASRIFDVTGGIFAVRFLTLTGGHVDAGAGVGEGGAIRTGAGTELHVESSTLTANSATGTAGARGGAISAQGDVFVERASGSTTSPVLTQNAVTSSGGPAEGGATAIRNAEVVVDSAVLNSNTASGASAHGGAIYGEGDVVLIDSTLSANHATGASASGGAVANDGAMTSVSGTTLSTNTATGTGAGLRSGGGAVAAVPGASLTDIDVNRSTLAGNRVEITGSPAGATAAGGALYDDTIGTTQVTASTVTGNTVAASGASAQGAAFSGSASGGSLGLAWSIVAENTGASQCAQATFSSFGYNVLGSLTGCAGATAGTDVTGVTDARLSPLGNHGGLTQTRLVVEPDSPALDLIPSGAGTCAVGTTDQRGVSRPQGAACEPGAAESRPASLVALPASRDWGNVPMSSAPSRNVAVSNAGEINIVLSPTLVVAAPFSATGCAGGVPGGSSCIVTVQAAPTLPGTYAATLSITAGALSDTVDLTAVGFGPTTLPAIAPAGDVASGTVLTVGDGAWTGSPTGFARQWVRCDADGASNCADVAGQTSATYATTAADEGHRLRVRVLAHSATVDSDPVTTAPSGLVSHGPAPIDPTTPTTPADPTNPPPAPTAPGDAIVRCTGRELTLLDFKPSGRKVAVRGLALSRRAGQQVALRAGTKTLGTATIAADGSFAATVTPPRTSGRVRLTAQVAESSSQAFAVERRFAIVSRKRSGNRVHVTARVAGGKRGAHVTIRSQVSCGKTERYGTAKLGRGGTFTIALPLPTAAEGVALYRAVAPIAGGTTFTLPIAVTASG